MGNWHRFREPLSKLYGRLRKIPGVDLGRGGKLYGVEIAERAEGEYKYVFDATGRTPGEAVDRARAIVRERFRKRR